MVLLCSFLYRISNMLNWELMLVCHMCCQACLHQGNQSCSAAGPLRRRRLPAGGSRALTEGCRPHTASITREKGHSDHLFKKKKYICVYITFSFIQQVTVEIQEIVREGRAEWHATKIPSWNQTRVWITTYCTHLNHEATRYPVKLSDKFITHV